MLAINAGAGRQGVHAWRASAPILAINAGAGRQGGARMRRGLAINKLLKY